MANSQAHASLSVMDDTMEISSDPGRQGDEDIDIDLDVPDERLPNDDDMAEDNDANRLDDDVMLDEYRPTEHVGEYMEEDVLDFDDEELADADTGPREEAQSYENGFGHPEGVIQESFKVDASSEVGPTEDASAMHAHPTESHSRPDEGVDSQSHISEAEPAPHHAIESEGFQQEQINADYEPDAKPLQPIPGVFDTENVGSPRQQNEGDLEDLAPPKGEAATDLSANADDDTAAAPVAPDEQYQDHDGAVGDNSRAFAPVTASGSGSNDEHATDDRLDTHEEGDAEGLETAETPDTYPHLHPVIVLWEDDEVPLFPPDDVSEYFLDDPSIATSPLSDVFAAFRQVLGDEHSNQLDLTIGFEDLGLFIDEHGCHNFQPTLWDIINLFLELHRNDSEEDPKPLRLSLTSRETATARFEALQQIASNGKGIGSVSKVVATEDANDETNEKSLESHRVYNAHVAPHSGNNDATSLSTAFNQEEATPLMEQDRNVSLSVDEADFTEPAVNTGETGNENPLDSKRSQGSDRDQDVEKRAKESDDEPVNLEDEEGDISDDLLDEEDEPEDDPELVNESSQSSTVPDDGQGVDTVEAPEEFRIRDSREANLEENQGEIRFCAPGQNKSHEDVQQEDVQSHVSFDPEPGPGLEDQQTYAEPDQDQGLLATGLGGVPEVTSNSTSILNESNPDDLHTESTDVSTRVEPDDDEDSEEALTTSKAEPLLDEDSRDLEDFDSLEPTFETQDDLVNEFTAEDNQDFLEDFEAAAALDDLENHEDADGNEVNTNRTRESSNTTSKAISDIISNATEEIPKVVRKRSREDYDDSEQVTEAKKARPA